MPTVVTTQSFGFGAAIFVYPMTPGPAATTRPNRIVVVGQERGRLEALRANREQVNAPATGAEHLENHDSERKDALVAGLPLASPVINTGMAKDIPARTITGDGRPLENSVTLELNCLDS